MNQIVNMLETDGRTVISNTDDSFPTTAAQIYDFESLVLFTGGSTIFSFADQHPSRIQNSTFVVSNTEEV